MKLHSVVIKATNTSDNDKNYDKDSSRDKQNQGRLRNITRIFRAHFVKQSILLLRLSSSRQKNEKSLAKEFFNNLYLWSFLHNISSRVSFSSLRRDEEEAEKNATATTIKGCLVKNCVKFKTLSTFPLPSSQASNSLAN